MLNDFPYHYGCQQNFVIVRSLLRFPAFDLLQQLSQRMQRHHRNTQILRAGHVILEYPAAHSDLAGLAPKLLTGDGTRQPDVHAVEPDVAPLGGFG